MKKITIQDLKDKNLILYEYVRGSHSHGIATEKSDIDIGGVFIAPPDMIYGMSSEYQSQVADETNDTVYYELGRWFELLLKSNPSALESLFIPENCIRYVHPLIQMVINKKDLFLSQSAFQPFLGYAFQQIKRCRGLNKKIVNPVLDKKNVLDFCTVPWQQGSIPLTKFLEKYNLKQEFCGLTIIPNMRDMYHVYYDWGSHKQLLNENNADDKVKIGLVYACSDLGQIQEPLNPMWVYNNNIYKPIGYKGICNPNDFSKSNDVRLSSIPRYAEPICQMSFNKDGYSTHCIKYKEYKEWEKNRNPGRYESNFNKNYDAKNVAECIRLIHTGIELARGEGFNVYRTWDRDFILDVKNHKFEYDYIIDYAESKRKEMEEAINVSTLKKEVDYNEVNQLLLDIRKKYYYNNKEVVDYIHYVDSNII